MAASIDAPIDRARWHPAGRRSFHAAVACVILAVALVATVVWSPPASAALKRVKDINPGGKSSNPGQMVRLGNWLYFAATDTAKGRELWKTNGTKSGTVRVKDIYPGAGSSDPEWLVKVGDYIYFAATDPAKGRELWRTKGTTRTTKRVLDVRPGSRGSDPRFLTRASSTLGPMCYFSADDGTNGTELWRVYANRSRKEMLEINEHPGHNGGNADPREITPVKGDPWLVATRESTWLYYGTQHMFDPRDAYPSGLTAVGSSLFLALPDTDAGPTGTRELWRVKNAPYATRKLHKVIDIVSGPTGGSDPQSLTNAGGVLYFSADDGVDGREPWRSSGGASNTYRLKDIASGAAGSDPSGFKAFDGKVYFSADDGASGREMWRSKGTGASRLKDIRRGSAGSDPRWFTPVANRLFFVADDGKIGAELWRTKGTSSTTRRVGDIRTGAKGSNPRNLTALKGKLYFVANDGKKGAELWRWTSG